MASAALRAWGAASVGRGGRSKKAIPSGVFLAAILCAGLNAIGQGPTAAEPPPDLGPVAAQEVERFIEGVRAEVRAKNRSRRAVNSKPSDGTAEEHASLPSRLAAASPEVQQAAVAVLSAQAEPLEQDLRKAAADLDQAIGEATAAWAPVRAALHKRGAMLERLREEQAGGLTALWSLDDHWFWASLLLAWAALAALAIHAHRHALRRRWGGRLSLAARRRFALAGFVLLACLVAGLGGLDRLADARRRGNVPSKSPPRATSDSPGPMDLDFQGVAPAVLPVEHSQAAIAEGSARRIAEARRLLPANATQLRDRALEVAERLEVLDRLPRAIQADLDRLSQLHGELVEAAAAADRLSRWRKAIRGLLGAVSLVGVAAGAWLLRREAGRRRARLANTCPLCLGAIGPGTASRNGRAGGAAAMVRCANVLDPAKGIRCDFAIRDAYRTMPKLCFPTLGVPRAGKTHWLAMTYWQLNRGGYPRWMRWERVRPVEVASGEDFDRVVEQILISRLGTSGTQGARIPHPLVFHFADGDPWGRSSLLVNLFDYSGEVTATMGVDDYRRRRAIEADGYLFFLDPTLPAEPQAKALADFREDLRLVRGVSGGRPLPLPLALCVSKIDLLASQPYALAGGGDAVARFYEELARIDPTGEAMTLDVLRARSRLTAELAATIWPGWHIERTVEDAFRGRWMFFPLTPVGLDGRGETDLSLRTIAPFGLVEPLAWLLHMNGYPVLP